LILEDEILENIEPIEYVNFFKRILIAIVEFAIMLLPLVLLYRATYFLAVDHQSVLILLSKWIVVLIFNLLLIISCGGTVGKLIFKVRIVDIHGKYPTVFKAIKRNVFWIVSSLMTALKEIINSNFSPLNDSLSHYSVGINLISTVATLLIIADLLTILKNPKRRALHDYIAGTYVVSKASVSSSPHQSFYFF
jgi:uncharacterized RDD family membrane protein YckC